jgi:GNAT superfamily N-acetyltransferase
MNESVLLDRNLRGLVALHALIGRFAGSLVEFDGAAGSVIRSAPDYPWLNALACERRTDFKRVLEEVIGSPELDKLAVWACEPEQVSIALAAGFTELVARMPAMSMELEHSTARDGASEPIELAEAGAVSDAAYGNRGREVETTLARLPADRLRVHGRRDTAGRVVAAALLLDVQDDCSVQYVATRPDAQRLGYGLALLSHALAQARLRGCTTTSLQSSEAGTRLYRHLGYRTVGHLQLLRRAASGVQ